MSRRFTRCKRKPSDWGWAVLREALQASASDLPELLWIAPLGWVVSWD